MNLSTASITEMLVAIQNGSLTKDQIWEHFHRVSTELNPELEAYNHLTADKPTALSGDLSGIPIAIKDVYSEK